MNGDPLNTMMNGGGGSGVHHNSNTVSGSGGSGSGIGIGGGGDSNSIIVLPSISIPNGSDEYMHNPRFASSSQYPHLAQVNKPPNFPQRRACIQASSVFCTAATFKWCLALQIILVLPLCLYIFDAHAQKRSAAIRLQQYNEEHEHILNQMMWMDEAADRKSVV